jgi:arylformamidase
MLIDITWPIEPNALLHPEDPRPQFTHYSEISTGADYNLTQLSISLHTGTHLDAPRHFFNRGLAIDELPLERFCCMAWVVDCGDAPCVQPRYMEGIGWRPGMAALFKTRNSLLPRGAMAQSWVYIAESTARLIVELGLSIAGMDYIEVESGVDEGRYPVHETLLDAGVMLLENLDLRHVAPGPYRLYCFPLKISGAEGSPCRAVLETLPR